MSIDPSSTANPELNAWRRFLARKTLWLGVLLSGSALVCAVAANWPALGKLPRFALVQGLMVLIVLAAEWLRWRLARPADMRRHTAGAVLALAGITLGALLALMGQTYQTGADNYQLFAWWALLLLPWAVAAASQPVWLLWVLVLNLAAAFWQSEHWPSSWLGFAVPGVPGLAQAALNLLLLLAWELAVRHWRVGTRVGPRVLAGLTVGVLVLALAFGGTTLSGAGLLTAIIWAAATLALGYFYQHLRRDLVILAMLAAGAMCVSLRLVGEWLAELQPGSWAALPLAGLLMAEAVWAARWLRGLDSPAAPEADAEPATASAGNEVVPQTNHPPPAPPSSQTPWYVHGLLGLSAWLATVLLLLFLGLSTSILWTSQGALVTGLAFCVAGVAAICGQRGLFWRQCATALTFAGQLLVVFGLWYDTDALAQASLFVLILAVIIYVVSGDALLRFLCGLLVGLAGAMLVWQSMAPWLIGDQKVFDMLVDNDGLRATVIWAPITVAAAWVGAASLYLAHRPWRGRRLPLEPLGWAMALSSQSAAWMAAGVPLPQWPALWALNPPAALSNALAALLPVLTAALLLMPRRAHLTRPLVVGVPLGLLTLAVFWLPSPGIALALTWMLLGFGLTQSRLRILGIASLLIYLGAYYYQLDVPLLQKALWMGAGGLLLLAMRVLLGRIARAMTPQTSLAPPPNRAPAPRWRSGLVLAGLAAALIVANGGIWRYENLLSSGQKIILELAPVDPRALMQGDYMALNFAVGTDIIRQDGPADGYLVLTPDARGVARTVRIQNRPQPQAAEEVALRYRVRRLTVRIVTNAYFFPEGEGAHYAQARYGEFRVDRNGTGLLVRLLSEDLQPL